MEATALAPGLGRRVVASLWAAAALPYLTLALWVPIARALGNALIAPIVALEPGNPERIRMPGTVLLSPDTFKAVVSDMAVSLKTQGFKHIILLGDNQRFSLADLLHADAAEPETEQVRPPRDRHADRDGNEAGGNSLGIADAAEPARQDDGEADEADLRRHVDLEREREARRWAADVARVLVGQSGRNLAGAAAEAAGDGHSGDLSESSPRSLARWPDGSVPECIRSR